MLHVRSLARERRNFVGEILSLATVSPLRSSDCNFYRSPGSIRIPFSVSHHARPISNLHSNVSHRRFRLPSNVLFLSPFTFFLLFHFFSLPPSSPPRFARIFFTCRRFHAALTSTTPDARSSKAVIIASPRKGE